MSATKKYRLGNQPNEYELSEKYLGWTPEGFDGWKDFHDEYSFCGRENRPSTITLVSPHGEEKVVFTLHKWVIKDAFPLEFFGEARADDWWNFLVLSKKEEPETEFIIPMS